MHLKVTAQQILNFYCIFLSSTVQYTYYFIELTVILYHYMFQLSVLLLQQTQLEQNGRKKLNIITTPTLKHRKVVIFHLNQKRNTLHKLQVMLHSCLQLKSCKFLQLLCWQSVFHISVLNVTFVVNYHIAAM